MIKVIYYSIDGVRKPRKFKTLKAARKFANDWVGPQDTEGGAYAVSNDGVGKVVWTGVTRAELFGPEPGPELNKVTTFYAKGDDLFCRRQGYTHDHDGQLFARVTQVMDPTGAPYYPAGWSLRHIDQLPLFDEDKVYHHRNVALAEAKNAFLDYLAYKEDE